MGIRMPGATTGLFDPKIVEQLIEIEAQPIESARLRREKYSEERDEFREIQQMLLDLDGVLTPLRTRPDFYKMKVESSHPDIIDGVIDTYTMTGTYEFEVRSLATSDKELAYGFPDRDKTPVGFGFMRIEREDQGSFDVTIEPGSSLQDVVNQINNTEAGVRAMIINTKYQPDPFRLLVVSEESGKEAKIHIDEDTTFLEFKKQVAGRNLDVLFEDVPVTDNDNILESLIDGVVFNVHRSEPGTRVQVSIVHDVDATLESISAFVEQYNSIAGAINSQYQIDPETNRAGILAADGSLKTIMRRLQGAIVQSVNTGGKFSTLGEVGITTNPQTGELNFDESKVRQSLSEDYDSVARLFIQAQGSVGVAGRLADAVRDFRDPNGGVLRSRMRSLDRVIENQDREIEKRERTLVDREESIRRRFTALESQLAGLQAQGNFLSQRFGGKSSEE